MSVCVTIRTTKELVAKDVIHKLVDQGEQLVVTSIDFPCVKFGRHLKSIRGVEINKENNGYKVRVCSFSSIDDYQLFVNTIQVVMQITGGKAYSDDDDKFEIVNPLNIFNNDWITSEYEAGFSTVHILSGYGHKVTMFGLFGKICVGPKLYQSFNIPLNEAYDKDDMNKLMEHLCSIQWSCMNLKDTSTHMVLPPPSSEQDNALSLSLISIKDGKVNEFGYISEADLLAIIDMDDKSIPPVLIPFNEVWKILPQEAFILLDELQYERVADVTVDMVHEMMNNARHLQTDDLHYKPTYPGEGFDNKQNTFILTWNPNISSVTLEDHRYGLENIFTEYFNWSIWDYKKVKNGDRFFLIAVGEGKTGVVMSGVFDSQPYEAEDWSGKGRQVYYIDMLPNVILDPENTTILSTKELSVAIPTFNWEGGHSGRMLSQEQAQQLETMWESFLNENKEKVDGKTFNVIRCHTYDKI